ncbi:helix-hairpin-helix domain-containing protein [Fimbriiglobus ruber]|uniref:Putative chaperonin n=1 Tax=Fimbriiglobus ruber TaxID=1908690 RepID=A0A225DGX8_9BACT|nr:hypothetical protein [Fimbriiglobus ruber]OWK40213.1 putative chaperonin [Fimbriiglobus ruber]
MTTRPLVNNLGQPVALGTLVGKGGEGSVYEVAGSPSAVAKIYDPSMPDRSAKFLAMASLAKKEMYRVAAWPLATLHDRPGGPAVGFVMHKVTGCKDIHILYSPAQRKTLFPHADWKFLIHTAANCAAGFDVIHGQGVVIGDVNQSNFMVSKDGLVTFIDCDSFQIQAGGRTHFCEVGVPPFTPPELQGLPFRGLTRTVNHDRFGLAVLIFHLLFMGRHPFAGRYSGQGDMPIEQAIREYRFPYSPHAGSYQMLPPLHSVPFAALSPQLQSLFEKAFRTTGPTAVRPAPAEWFTALKAFFDTLRPCTQDPGHQTPSHVSGCIWCDLVKQGAPNFFVSVTFTAARGSGPAFILATVWARIEAVPRPNVTYVRPAPMRRTPNPWSATLPQSVPPAIARPTLLTHPPSPPRPNLPPPQYQRKRIPYSHGQRVTGYVAIAFLTFLIPVAILGTMIGQAAFGRPTLVAAVLALIDLLLLAASGVRWMILELDRRATEHRQNEQYEQEREERDEIARQQRDEWYRQLKGRQADAERQYNELTQRWRAATTVAAEEVRRRKSRFQAAMANLEQSTKAWAEVSAKCAAEFDHKKAQLTAFRQKHTELAPRYQSEQQRLVAQAHEMQKMLYLQSQYIADHDIPDIGDARKSTLALFGIETAFDVERDAIFSVPGFKEKLTGRLLTWRAGVEARFAFNAIVGVPPHEQQALDFKFFQERQVIETHLLQGESELKDIASRATKELGRISDSMTLFQRECEQADADLAVIPHGF